MTTKTNKLIRWRSMGSIWSGGHTVGKAEGLRGGCSLHNLTGFTKRVDGKRVPTVGIYAGAKLVEKVQAEDFESVYKAAKARAEELVPAWIAAQAQQDAERAEEDRLAREERERALAERNAARETMRALVASGRLSETECAALRLLVGGVQ